MQTTYPVIPLKLLIGDGLWRQNIVTVRLLALCPMLAVSVSLSSAATLGLLTLLVMVLAGWLVAVLRPLTPAAVRLPIFLTLVALLVAISDLSMAALAPTMHERLGIFLPLIITNCAVLARLEVFAAKQPPLAAAMDGAANGSGMLVALVLLASVRELIGTGGIAGLSVSADFQGIPLALLPAGGFILFAGLLIGGRLLGVVAPHR